MKYKCSILQISVLQVSMKLSMLYLAVIYAYSSKNNKIISQRQGAKEAIPYGLVFSTLYDQQLWSSFERSATSPGMTTIAQDSSEKRHFALVVY